MPKSPKVGREERPKHNALAQDYSPYQPLKQKAPKKRKHRDEENGQSENVVGAKASRRILSLGQDLQEEDNTERQARYVSGTNEGLLSDPRLGLDAAFYDDDDEDENEEDPEAWEDDEDEQMEAEV
jgi:essential nuclear protein 1